MSRARIAVVGAGRMGIGISQVFAYAGYEVDLLDMKERPAEDAKRVLDEAARQIEGNVRFMVTLGLLGESAAEAVCAQVRFHSAPAADSVLPAADFVFEAVPEILESKRSAFFRIGEIVRPDCVVASTTSTFLVDTLAGFVRNPERFVNTHWLNPAYLIPLVEVSPGKRTGQETLNRVFRLLEEAGKVPVQCAASPGFIVPRIQAVAMNEAARIVEEGAASPEAVDRASRIGFGLRFAVLGLLEFIDWGGGDILYYADRYLQEALGSDRFAPPNIIAENMEQGKIGMKAGRGFYNFADTDVVRYQQETLRKFVDLLNHLGHLPKLGSQFQS